MKFRVLGVVSLYFLAGCAAETKPHLVIDGKEYVKNKNGVIQLSESELNVSLSNGGLFYEVDNQKRLELSPEQLAAATHDSRALAAMFGMKPKSGEVISILKKGSLRENLERISSEYGWNEVIYDGPEYYISEDSMLRADNMVAAINLINDTFPVFACVDKNRKEITVIRQLER